MRPETKLNKRFQFTGYCRWQSPEIEEIDQRVLEFTGGRPTLILTFGSMVYQAPDTYVERLLNHWPEDRKLILQTGWSGFRIPKSASHILQIGPVSHDQLFRAMDRLSYITVEREQQLPRYMPENLTSSFPILGIKISLVRR